MYLHFLKNSRTFDVQNTSEKSEPNFLNQNKAQAIRCKSFNFPLSGVFSSDLGLCFRLKNCEMLNTPKTTTTQTIPAIDYSGHRLIKTVRYDSNGFGLQIEFNDGRESLTLWCNNEALDRQLPVEEQCITCRNKALYDDFFVELKEVEESRNA